MDGDCEGNLGVGGFVLGGCEYVGYVEGGENEDGG